jgi:hypothetical protein
MPSNQQKVVGARCLEIHETVRIGILGCAMGVGLVRDSGLRHKLQVLEAEECQCIRAGAAARIRIKAARLSSEIYAVPFARCFLLCQIQKRCWSSCSQTLKYSKSAGQRVSETFGVNSMPEELRH